MLAVFQVGKSEVHTVEVYSSLTSGKEIVKVDGEEVINKKKFPIWFTDYMQFEVGEEEKYNVELKYNAMTFSSRVYVNGQLHIGCLFPQVAGCNAIIIAYIALAVTLITGIFILSTTSEKNHRHSYPYSIDKEPPHALHPLGSPAPSETDRQQQPADRFDPADTPPPDTQD
jgi:hypothetical protein